MNGGAEFFHPSSLSSSSATTTTFFSKETADAIGRFYGMGILLTVKLYNELKPGWVEEGFFRGVCDMTRRAVFWPYYFPRMAIDGI
jgi:hypothetical protein